jgi:flagellar hook-basal body complex protein FliE
MPMTFKLPAIAPIEAPDTATPASAAPTSAGTGESPFKDVLSSAIGQVENARTSADQGIQQFLAGEGGDLHSTILASQRADLEFQMFLQVRNKVVSAYQEIMKMQM